MQLPSRSPALRNASFGTRRCSKKYYVSAALSRQPNRRQHSPQWLHGPQHAFLSSRLSHHQQSCDVQTQAAADDALTGTADIDQGKANGFFEKIALLWWSFQVWRATKWLEVQPEGLDNLADVVVDPCVLFAANHSSELDHVFIVEALKEAGFEHIYLLGDKSWAGNPFSQTWKIIPVTSFKGFNMQDLQAIEQSVVHHVENMEPVAFVLFPEGTVSSSGGLQRFKLGTGYLTSKLGCKVVPTLIQGSFQVLPRGALIPTRHPVSVSFAKPIAPLDDLATADDNKVFDPERRLSSARRQQMLQFDESIRQQLTELRRQSRAAKRPLGRSARRLKLQVKQQEASTGEEDWRVKLYTALVMVLKPVDYLGGWIAQLLHWVAQTVQLPLAFLLDAGRRAVGGVSSQQQQEDSKGAESAASSKTAAA